MNMIISGSLAYDRIMDFPDSFRRHILPEKIHLINVSFTVPDMPENFGGTAGNIAYNLHLLGQSSTIISTAGNDFNRYKKWLTKNHIRTNGISMIPHEHTSSGFIMTDQDDNQISAFHLGAMKHRSKIADHFFSKESFAILAPGNIQDMLAVAEKCRKHAIPYIFDPGQTIPRMKKTEILQLLKNCSACISNDYELELILQKLKLSKKKLLTLTSTVITTLGEKGSMIQTGEKILRIPAIKPKKIVDPTGAGDAYRAGFLKALVSKKDLETCGLWGACAASFAIEKYGTQNHHFTLKEFNHRLETI